MQVEILLTEKSPYIDANVLNEAFNWLVNDNNGVYKIQELFDKILPSIKNVEIADTDFYKVKDKEHFETLNDETIIAVFDATKETQFSCFVDALYHAWGNAQNDPINPSHYKKYGMEAIDVIMTFTQDLKGFKATDTGNIIKYILRWPNKNGLEDLKKAQWYLNHLINELQKEEKGEQNGDKGLS